MLTQQDFNALLRRVGLSNCCSGKLLLRVSNEITSFLGEKELESVACEEAAARFFE